MKTINDKIENEITEIFNDFSNDKMFSEQAVKESMKALSVIKHDTLFRTLTIYSHAL